MKAEWERQVYSHKASTNQPLSQGLSVWENTTVAFNKYLKSDYCHKETVDIKIPQEPTMYSQIKIFSWGNVPRTPRCKLPSYTYI